MKKLFILLTMSVSFYCNLIAQDITPLRSSEQCPGTNIVFTVTIAAQSIQNVQPKALNVNPTVVQQPYNISNVGGNITFNFVGRFADYNNKQTFTVNYTNSSGVASQWDATYIKIKSLLVANGFSQVNPSPGSITSAMCQVNNHNISFSNVQYGNPFEAPAIGYGTVTNYEYLIPSGWVLNGTTSNGSTWIPGSNTVTVTSDLGSGDGNSIRIRPVNTACGAGLQFGQEAIPISISRPVNLSISGAATICGSSSTYTLNGLPPSSTVSWSINNPNTASIPNPSNGTSVTVTKITDGLIVLTATVTLCNGETRNATKNITLGSYAFGTYQYTSNYSNGYNALGSTNSHFIPANQTMSFMINLGNTDFTNITWTSTGSYSVTPVPNGFGGCSFYMVSAPTAYASRTATLTINATGPCGSVNRSFNFTLITQGWGFRMQMSPNPATDNLIVSITDESPDVKTLSQDETITMTLYDINRTNIVRQWKFKNNQSRFNLNVSDVKMGHYVLVVQKGKHQQSAQIFIE